MEVNINNTLIQYSINDNSVDIHFFFVPEELREEGLGTRSYFEFEKSLPKNITLVQLEAGDTEGKGSSHYFWSSLGFIDSFEHNEDDQEFLHSSAFNTMHKSINEGDFIPPISRKEWLDMA